MIKLSTEIRKEQIKEAVLEIIYQDGISKFTTKRLAERIGISEAAIFRHFASKKEIFIEILSDVDSQLLSEMSRIEHENASADVRLHKIVCRTIHYIIKNKGVSVLMLSEIAENNHPEIRDKVQCIFSGQRKIVERVADEGIQKGELSNATDPKAISLLYMGIPVAIHIELLLNKTEFFEEGFCERMSTTFLQSYIKPDFKPRHNSKHLL
ncbi:MAG: TetR/AcrR family transcriptional regulator [Bacteroidales bacterium]|jgi:AcrR family transcriptional regulator|nr:TetR/AcrR family transcriptional regulator [Bacteroidales bacterium]